jgi:hypothetical protein
MLSKLEVELFDDPLGARESVSIGAAFAVGMVLKGTGIGDYAQPSERSTIFRCRRR